MGHWLPIPASSITLVTSIDISRELVTHIRIIAKNTSVGSTVCQYHGRLQDVKRLRCIRARAGLVSQISKDYNTCGHVVSLNTSISRDQVADTST